MVVNESLYPGWSARIEGRSLPIWRANHLFMAVLVPAGTSQVDFVFSSARIRIGFWITALTAALIIGLQCFGSERLCRRPVLALAHAFHTLRGRERGSSGMTLEEA